ncbi:MAG: hypothetical protein M3Q14_03660 [bacterium]|nr:hypothetical protein [bacterium]
MKNKHRKKGIITSLIIIFLAAGIFTWAVFFSSNPVTTPNSENSINYGPPTVEEKAAGDRQKQQIDEEQNNTDNSPLDNSSKKSVSVIITDASQYEDIIEVRSFIPDYFQDGTCTIVFRKDNLTLTKTAPAYKDISTTICTNPEIKRSEFATSGEWQVTVSYESTNAKGTSETQIIKLK